MKKLIIGEKKGGEVKARASRILKQQSFGKERVFLEIEGDVQPFKVTKLKAAVILKVIDDLKSFVAGEYDEVAKNLLVDQSAYFE